MSVVSVNGGDSAYECNVLVFMYQTFLLTDMLFVFFSLTLHLSIHLFSVVLDVPYHNKCQLADTCCKTFQLFAKPWTNPTNCHFLFQRKIRHHNNQCLYPHTKYNQRRRHWSLRPYCHYQEFEGHRRCFRQLFQLGSDDDLKRPYFRVTIRWSSEMWSCTWWRGEWERAGGIFSQILPDPRDSVWMTVSGMSRRPEHIWHMTQCYLIYTSNKQLWLLFYFFGVKSELKG